MIPEKENPLLVDTLDGETKQGADDASGMPSRLNRYSKAHHRALHMADYARERGDVKISAKLHNCGNYLLFRNYYTVGKVRLHAARFCNKHLLCPLCAIRRGAKQVKAYLDRLQVIQSENKGLRASLLTLTVKDGEDLGERFRHLTNSFRRLQGARRSYLAGKGPHVELAKVLGAVGSYEFKRGKNSGLWHPHVHMVVLHRDDFDLAKFAKEWKATTGDSHILDVTPFHDQEDPVSGFLEVFKYALKFSDMPLDDNWQGFKTLSGKRLVFSFGLFWGVQVPEDLSDEQLDDLPFIEELYRFVFGAGYSLERATMHQQKAKNVLTESKVVDTIRSSTNERNQNEHDGSSETGFPDRLPDQVPHGTGADGVRLDAVPRRRKRGRVAGRRKVERAKDFQDG